MGATRMLKVLALALLVPLAGCLGGDDGTSDGLPTSPTDDDRPAFTKEEAATVFSGAASSLTADDGPTRVAVKFRADAMNASEPEYAEMSGLFDREKGLVVFAIKGQAAEGMEGNPFATPGSALVLGQVWKTAFFGSSTQIVGTYNESAEPPSNLTDVSGPAMPGSGESEEGFDEGEFLKFLGNPTASGIANAEPVIHDRKPALKITFSQVEEGATVTGEAVVVMGPPARLAYVAGTIKDPDAENGYERDATFRVDVTYEDAATHELESTLERLEVMTFAGNGGGFNPFGGGEPADTFTVQPSHSAVSIPLADVEARVVEQSGFGGDPNAEPTLVLALEAGSAENADVAVAFTDADADGKVSAGDFLKLDVKNPEKSYTVQLKDEKTGVVLLPGFGLALGLLALAGVALAARRSR